MDNKFNLFDDNDYNNEEGFKINKDYVKKFNYNKEREEKERLKNKYKNGKIIEDFSSDSISEDEEGDLINPNFNKKFYDVLNKLKNKHPDIYKEDWKFFEEDNIYKNEKIKKSKNEIFNYQKMVKEGKIESDSEDEIKNKKMTPNEEKVKLRQAFINAANDDEIEDEDFLKIKKNNEDEEDDEKHINENNKNNIVEYNIPIKSKEDKFIFNYLNKERWKDSNLMNFEDKINFKTEDKEDDLNSEKFDEFEEKYNFRYEDPEGHFIKTYERNIEDVHRKKNNKRQEKRKEYEQRKLDKKNELKKENEKLKEYKKEEILKRVKKIQQISGIRDEKIKNELINMLENNYDQEKIDKVMSKIFNDDYYEKEDSNNEEIEDYLENIEENFEGDFDLNKNKEIKPIKDKNKFDEDIENVLIPKPNIPIQIKRNLNNEESKIVNEENWWFCDLCNKGLQELEIRFDCLECPDYTECKNCNLLKEHNHKMKKFLVPKGCGAPNENILKETLDNFYICYYCKIKLNKKNDNYFKNKKMDNIYLCNYCFNYNNDDFNLRDLNEIVNDKNKEYNEIINENELIEEKEQIDNKLIKNDEKLLEMIDEYNNLDYEDIISGGIKTRYKYIDVDKNSYGLTDAELWYADDKILTQMLSVKKLAPYKENAINPKDKKRIKKLRALVRKSAEINQKKFKEILKLEEKEKNLKRKKNLNKKNEKEYQNFLLEKEKKLNEWNKIEFKVPKNITLEYVENLDLEDNNKEEEEKNNINIDEKRLKSYGL